LRDGDPDVTDRIGALPSPPALSILTRVELEGAVARHPAESEVHRANIDALVSRLAVFPFDDRCADCYSRIVVAAGWSRTRIFDRMIAATAIANDRTLITMNGRDFSDIPGLSLQVWPSPAA